MVKHGKVGLILKVAAFAHKCGEAAPRLDANERSLLKRRSPYCKHGITCESEFKGTLAVLRHNLYVSTVKIFAKKSITIKIGIGEVQFPALNLFIPFVIVGEMAVFVRIIKLCVFFLIKYDNFILLFLILN